MAAKTSSQEFLPSRLNLSALRKAAAKCKGGDLYLNATQPVFGEGPRQVRMLLMGEVPGDQEDKDGRPFVGPAGRMLDDCLDEAGIARDDVYFTNAVKHFRWETRGKRRLHKKPTSRHIEACRPWLQAEILCLKPDVVVYLGATAAQTMLGRDFPLPQKRGRFFHTEEVNGVTATYHPSAVLRAPKKAGRTRIRSEFVLDLQKASDHFTSRT